MPQIETIKASQAPKPAAPVSQVAQEVRAALEPLGKDEVLKIAPDAGKSIRGLKVSIGRIASNAGIKIRSWSDDEYVYVTKEP